MGTNQSNTKQTNVMRMRSSSKAYVLPVVITPSKLHNSSSFSTEESMKSERTVKSSVGKFRASSTDVGADKEMLSSLLSTYDTSSILGRGSSAQVFEVTHKGTGEKFACKVVQKGNINDERTMCTETEIMIRLQHENVIQLHELYETTASRWFIMELANSGTLQAALAKEIHYTEELVAGLFKQVLSGVKHLHNTGVVHRDLKPENILCSIVETENGEQKYVAKIADFGLSAVVGMNTYQDSAKMNKEIKSFSRLKDTWGTKEYLAPEVYKKAYGPQVDVWSLGCVLYELLTGVAAFPEREHFISVVEKYMLNGGKDLRRSYQMRPQWQELSAQAQDLINNMLLVNPKRRFSIQECVNHPFIRSARPEVTMRTTASSEKKVNSTSIGSRVEINMQGQVVESKKPRGSVLVGAHNAAIKNTEASLRRLKSLKEQGEYDFTVSVRQQ